MTVLSSIATKKKKLDYNKERRQFIEEMCFSPEVVTRIQCAASENIPPKFLRQMLLTEEDFDVLQTLLSNPRIAIEALRDFIAHRPDTITQLEKDNSKIIENLQRRTNGE